MSALSVPFHFTTTFLVALGAFAGVWLAVSRPDFSPKGWARLAFGLGWALLAGAETIHGAQILTSDVDGRLLALRSGAYLLLLLSLAIPLERAGASGGSPQPSAPRRGLWAVGALAVTRAAAPAVLGLGAGVVAARSRLEGARRLATALILLGASEVLLVNGGAASERADFLWFAAHGLHLLGGLALGVWLWRAFRVSIQARFVAALVLLLVIVIALISATVTSVFARSVRRDAFRAAEAGAVFENGRIETLASNAGALAVVLANIQGVPQYVASRAPELKELAIRDQSAGGFLERADFLAFFSADRQYLGLSATAGPGKPPNLDESDVVTLSGSAEVRTALQGKATYSVDDIGLGHSKLALIGAAPVFAPAPGGSGSSNTVVGAVALGQIINTSVLQALQLPAPQSVSLIGSDGAVLGSTIPSGAQQIVRAKMSGIKRNVIEQGQSFSGEATVGRSSYYVLVAPLKRRPDQVVRGALMVTQPQTLGGTQSTVSRTLFLGALAATLFAVGASSVSGSRITRPIRDLTAAAEQVRQGDLTARVPVIQADEIGVLGEAFNEMTTSLDSLAAELRESALEESRLRGELETILQSMTDGLVAVDLSCRVATINREAERILGIPAERARGMRVQDVLAVHDSIGGSIDLPVYRLGSGSAAGFVAAYQQDGQGLPVAVTSAPITDEKGSPAGAVAVLRDLTSELEVEQMKTEFLSNISHELRTPLTPIKGYADLLRRKVVPRAKTISFLNIIVASTERMERIVDMLVDFSAMQAGRLVVRTAPFDLDRATADLVSKWREAAPNHSFERTGFDDLPAVAGDARLLPRAIDELIDNAVKFSPDGGPVSVRGEIDAARPDRVRVSVADRGIGISAAQKSRIFQDFVQVDASETRAFGGLGLGLAYVRRIIEAHDGELQVESTAGEGSRFSLLIPLQRTPGDTASVPRRTTPEPPVPVSRPERPAFSSRRPPAEWPGGR